MQGAEKISQLLKSYNDADVEQGVTLLETLGEMMPEIALGVLIDRGHARLMEYLGEPSRFQSLALQCLTWVWDSGEAELRERLLTSLEECSKIVLREDDHYAPNLEQVPKLTKAHQEIFARLPLLHIITDAQVWRWCTGAVEGMWTINRLEISINERLKPKQRRRSSRRRSLQNEVLLYLPKVSRLLSNVETTHLTLSLGQEKEAVAGANHHSQVALITDVLSSQPGLSSLTLDCPPHVLQTWYYLHHHLEHPIERIVVGSDSMVFKSGPGTLEDRMSEFVFEFTHMTEYQLEAFDRCIFGANTKVICEDVEPWLQFLSQLVSQGYEPTSELFQQHLSIMLQENKYWFVVGEALAKLSQQGVPVAGIVAKDQTDFFRQATDILFDGPIDLTPFAEVEMDLDSWATAWYEQGRTIDADTAVTLQILKEQLYRHPYLEKLACELTKTPDLSSELIRWSLIQMDQMVGNERLSREDAEVYLRSLAKQISEPVDIKALLGCAWSYSYRDVKRIDELLLDVLRSEEKSCSTRTLEWLIQTEKDHDGLREYTEWATSRFTDWSKLSQDNFLLFVGRLKKLFQNKSGSMNGFSDYMRQKLETSGIELDWLEDPLKSRRSLRKYASIFVLDSEFSAQVRERSADLPFDTLQEVIQLVVNGQLSDLTSEDINRLLTVNVPQNFWYNYASSFADNLMILFKSDVLSRDVLQKFLRTSFGKRFYYHSWNRRDYPTEMVALLMESFKDHPVSWSEDVASVKKLATDFGHEFTLQMIKWDGFFDGYGRVFMSDDFYDYVSIAFGALSTEQQHSFVRRNLENGFKFSTDAPKALYETLFEVLSQSKFEYVWSSSYISDVLEAAKLYDLDTDQVVPLVNRVKGIFGYVPWSRSKDRALQEWLLSRASNTAVQIPLYVDGETSEDFLETRKDVGRLLRQNFEHSFCYHSDIDPELYAILFETFAAEPVGWSHKFISELHRAAYALNMEPSIDWGGFLDGVTCLFSGRTQLLYSQKLLSAFEAGEISKSELHTILLRCFAGRVNTRDIFTVSELDAHLWEVLESNKDSVSMSTKQVKALKTLSERSGLGTQLIMSFQLSITNLFTSSAESLVKSILQDHASGLISDEDLQSFIRQNLAAGFNSWNARWYPAEMNDRIWGALKDWDETLSDSTVDCLLTFGTDKKFDCTVLLPFTLRGRRLHLPFWLEQVEQENLQLDAVRNHLYQGIRDLSRKLFEHESSEMQSVAQVIWEEVSAQGPDDTWNSAQLVGLLRFAEQYDLDSSIVDRLMLKVSDVWTVRDGTTVASEIIRLEEAQQLESSDVQTLLTEQFLAGATQPLSAYAPAVCQHVSNGLKAHGSPNEAELLNILLHNSESLTGYLDWAIVQIPHPVRALRKLKELVPKYWLRRHQEGVQIPFHDWYWCVNPTDDELQGLVQAFTAGGRLPMSKAVLQDCRERLELIEGGADYAIYCAQYFASRYSKVLFEGWSSALVEPCLDGLPENLTQIDWVHGDCQQLPERIGAFKQLSKLILYGQPLASLPDSVLNHENLKTLSISKTQIPSIIPLLEIPALEKLYCKEIPLTDADKQLAASQGVELVF